MVVCIGVSSNIVCQPPHHQPHQPPQDGTHCPFHSSGAPVTGFILQYQPIPSDFHSGSFLFHATFVRCPSSHSWNNSSHSSTVSGFFLIAPFASAAICNAVHNNLGGTVFANSLSILPFSSINNVQ